MNDSKPWYMSRTIWAALVSTGASIGSFLGIETDPGLRADLTDELLQLIATIGGIAAIYGRMTARDMIT